MKNNGVSKVVVAPGLKIKNMPSRSQTSFSTEFYTFLHSTLSSFTVSSRLVLLLVEDLLLLQGTRTVVLEPRREATSKKWQQALFIFYIYLYYKTKQNKTKRETKAF